MRRRRDARGLVALVVAMLCLAAVALVQHTHTEGDTTPVAYTPPRVSPFVDVPGTSTGSPHTFYGEIAWLSDRGISTGYAGPTGRTFDPAAPVLREQMAAFLYRLAGEPDVVLPRVSPFADVPTTHPFFKHIVWLRGTGVTTGYTSPGGVVTFRGSQPVLREQMAAFLFRFRTWEAGGTAPSASGAERMTFSDVAASHVFAREIGWLASSAVTTGYDEQNGTRTFRPAAAVLREQMAAFLFRYDGLPDAGPTNPPTTPPASSLPVISDVAVTTPTGTGQNRVVLRGENFVGATDVSFSGVSAPSFTVDDPTTITAVVPPLQVSDEIDVVVTTPAGPSLPGLLMDLPPSGGASLDSLTPPSGFHLGGTAVTITGSGFANVVAVTFDGVQATSFEVLSPTKIVAIAPPKVGGGRATVTVYTESVSATGTRWRLPSNGLVFTYRLPEPPVVSAVTPARGEVTGGTAVRITGNWLGGPTKVMFGDQEATSFTAESQWSVLAIAPPAAGPGRVPVTVTTFRDTSTAKVYFEYVPVDPRPVITTTTLPTVVALDGYDQRLTTKDGRPGEWEVVAGDLPPGVTLVGDRLTGAPTQPGLHGFAVRFTDELDQQVQVDLALHVGTPTWIPGQAVSSRTRVNVPLVAPMPPFMEGSSSTSDDGRYVAFSATEDIYAVGDLPERRMDVFLRDTVTGQTVLVSRTAVGTSGNGGSYDPTISADGRFVAFPSEASDLVEGDTNEAQDVFVYDRDTETVERISRAADGGQSATGSGGFGTSISSDGRYVVFPSSARDLVDGHDLTTQNVFRYDRATGTTELVSLPVSGAAPFDSGAAGTIAVSPDGQHVAYVTPQPTAGGTPQVVVRDMEAEDVEIVSVSMHGVPGNKGVSGRDLAISANGRFVVFGSSSTNLVPGSAQGGQLYVRDRTAGTTSLVSASVSGHPGGGQSGANGLDISDDGRYIAFSSTAADLVHGDSGSIEDVFVRDRVTGLTSKVSTTQQGPSLGAGPASRATFAPGGGLSSDGRRVVVQLTQWYAGQTFSEAIVDLHDLGPR